MSHNVLNCDSLKSFEEVQCTTNSIISIKDPKGKSSIRVVIKNDDNQEYCFLKLTDLGCKDSNCDYLMIRCVDSKKILIELKGDGDKNKAALQILSSWEYLKQKYDRQCDSIVAIIISDKCRMPSYNKLNYTRLVKRITETKSNFFDRKPVDEIIID